MLSFDIDLPSLDFNLIISYLNKHGHEAFSGRKMLCDTVSNGCIEAV
jgi:hypothetical protein